jgi:cellulose synthase/poly-beta-1,6-N-acetylglucosamine synthase-like glycosyltransferase
MRVTSVISLALQAAVAVPVAYLYLLAGAALRSRSTRPSQHPRHRFAIAIPAHDEAGVIGTTVAHLRRLSYPSTLFDIHVVADHCADATAAVARAAGATVHERQAGPRGSKGAALRWLFRRVLDESSQPRPYDAVVIFDADTHVAPDFLRLMDARLSSGDVVIQGQHRIRNPEDGWFPALAWAMFIIDNRLQNAGRAMLGWSAKNMGDSICLRADVLRRLGWGEGLTEDYAFRQRLLLDGIRIAYEPAAVGYGEAPLTWQAAAVQRARWLRGTRDASRHYAHRLLRQGLRRMDLPLLDGALQASLPSYSSLSLAAMIGWLVQTGVARARRTDQPTGNLWSLLTGALVVYPLLGLALERAPLRAYAAILVGPAFVLWRTQLALTARLRGEVVWVRTPRKVERRASADATAGNRSA